MTQVTAGSPRRERASVGSCKTSMLARLRSPLLRMPRRGMAGGPDGRPRLDGRGHKKVEGGPMAIGHTQ